MKPDSDRNRTDPLRDMLGDDAAHLPGMAARAAREHRARSIQMRGRLARAAAVVLLGVCAWQAVHWTGLRRQDGGEVAGNPVVRPAPAGVRLENFVRVQTVEDAVIRPLPAPAGASEEQRALLDTARGLPLLVLMDPSGKPTQIVVVER